MLARYSWKKLNSASFFTWLITKEEGGVCWCVCIVSVKHILDGIMI